MLKGHMMNFNLNRLIFLSAATLLFACGSDNTTSDKPVVVATPTPTPTPIPNPTATPAPTPDPNESLKEILLGAVDISKDKYRLEILLQVSTLSNFGAKPYEWIDNEVFEVTATIDTIKYPGYTMLPNTVNPPSNVYYVPVDNGFGKRKIVIDFSYPASWNIEIPVVFEVCRKDQNPNDAIIIEKVCSQIWVYLNRESKPIALP